MAGRVSALAARRAERPARLAVVTALATPEERRAELEAAVRRGQARQHEAQLEQGHALLALRSERLYLQTHDDWNAYCLERFNFGESRASQLITYAAGFTAVKEALGRAPRGEREAREVLKYLRKFPSWNSTIRARQGSPPPARPPRPACATSLHPEQLYLGPAGIELVGPQRAARGRQYDHECPKCGHRWDAS